MIEIIAYFFAFIVFLICFYLSKIYGLRFIFSFGVFLVFFFLSRDSYDLGIISSTIVGAIGSTIAMRAVGYLISNDTDNDADI